jgi:hemoglobin
MYFTIIFTGSRRHMYDTVNEECIADMVDTFYAKVREDAFIGPVFLKAIGADWAPHLIRMKQFWSTILLASASYKGNPMMAHILLPRLTRQHFARWLQLWREVAARLCSEAVASIFVQRAETIGERLLGAISMYHELVSREAAEVVQGEA